jgi:hypothetical protein
MVSCANPGQEQRRAKQIAVGGGKADVVVENVVERSLSHCDFPLSPRLC